MGIRKTFFTNSNGNKQNAIITDLEYQNNGKRVKEGQTPTDTVVVLKPEGMLSRKVILSGPDSKYYQFDNSIGEYIPADNTKDWFNKTREAVKNASEELSWLEKLKYVLGFKQGGKMDQMIQAIIKGIVEDVPEILQQLSQLSQEQQQQILQMIHQRAQQGDEMAIKAIEKLSNPKKAKLGAKLNYIKRLKKGKRCCKK